MAGNGLSVTRLRALLGPDAVVAARDAGVWIAPRTEAACALALQTASGAGWTVRLEGRGTWTSPDGPADLVLSTRRLDALVDLSAADLVATAQAGIAVPDLRRRLADAGAWLAIDPPGTDRSLGSVVVTGTSGPLRCGFGPVRDQLLGLTLVTGDGRVLRVGGRVMKNVAGYDLTRLTAGSFGMFGLVTSVHLRLRAVPRADRTLYARGARDGLLEAAGAVLATGVTPAALELLSPRAGGAPSWTLALRLIGTDTEVRAARDIVRSASPVPLTEPEAAAGAALWRAAAHQAVEDPVTLRLGTLPTALDEALDLVAHHLDEPVADWISVTVAAGTIRWSGSASAERLALLRRVAAEREMPVTLERAPWPVRAAVGTFGAYREGVARLVDGLRHSFDPAGALV